MGSLLKILKAKWVLPISSKPLQDACVLIADSKIESVIPANKLSQFIAGREYILYDHGNAIILPGFINLHTHLEHTDLKILAKQTAFFEWLPKLMEATVGWSTGDRMSSAANGAKESILAGTTMIIDFSYNGASITPLVEQGLRAIVGLEIFGVDESMVEEQWSQWLERRANFLANPIVQAANREDRLSITVSPHAPYTVCPALWQKAKEWSKSANLPIFTHLAESKEEFNWFKMGDNTLKQFLIYAFSKRVTNFAQLYETQTNWKGEDQSPVEHLYANNLLENNLLAAHCVQIDEFDINLLKTAGVSIAHCPNSNSILKCGLAPLQKLLDRDVKVGLGTDSAASSKNLDLLEEAAFAIKAHESSQDGFQLEAKQALELITIKAATCLGLQNKLGSLQAGKLADIGVFALPDYKKNGTPINEEDLYSLLIDGACRLKRLLVNGKTIYYEEEPKV